MKCKEQNTLTNDNTPYDDVGKTLLHGCPSFMIPIVNEIFGENYSMTDIVELSSEGHFLQESTEKINKGYKDSYFKIIGEKTGKYHIEIQSYQDNTIILRMFEYDIGAGISESFIDDNKLIISIVKSAIIYLRHNKNTPNIFIVELQTPGGNISYEIPILKSQTYSLDEIFQKKLWYLLPYYLFCYQKDFFQIESDEDKLQKLKNEYKRIKEELNSLHYNEEITLYEKQTLISMIKKVARKLAVNHKKIYQGVNEHMGGKVLMHEAEALTQNGIRKGIALEKKNTEIERKRADEATAHAIAEKARADEATAHVKIEKARADEAVIRANEALKEIAHLKELLLLHNIIPTV